MTQPDADPLKPDRDIPPSIGMSLLKSEWSTQVLAIGIGGICLWRIFVLSTPFLFGRPSMLTSLAHGILLFAGLLLFPLLTRRQTTAKFSPHCSRMMCLREIGWAVLFTAGWISVSNAVIAALMELWPNLEFGAEQYSGLEYSEPTITAIVFAVLATFVTPVIEEIFFRGFLFNALRKRIPLTIAAVVQGTLFGFLHQYSLAGIIYIGASGICLAALYQWRQSLIAPIVVHSLYNGLVFASMLYAGHAFANTPIIGVNTDLEASGCRITQVYQHSPAETGGLRVGDDIIGLGAFKVESFDDLIAAISYYESGDMVTVWFKREGEEDSADVILFARKLLTRNPASPELKEE